MSPVSIHFRRPWAYAVLFTGSLCWGQQPQQLPSQQAESQSASPTTLNPEPMSSASFGQASAVPPNLQGSVPFGKRSDEVIPLSLTDAIQRGLKANLGIVSGTQTVRFSRAERLRALNSLLPTLTTRTTATSEQVDLAAFGFSGFPGFPTIVGPFQVYDTRAYLSQNVLNFNAIENRRSARSSYEAAQATFADTRDQVVLAVVYLYLQAVASLTRVETTQAELTTAEALYRQAVDQKTAGVVAGIDVLRAQVEQQSQRQRLIADRANAEKQKINLGRAIGLPLGQQFQIVDRIPYVSFPLEDADATIQQAYKTRRDLQSLLAQVKSAEFSKKAAYAERYPTVTLDANYGAIGKEVTSTHGTYTVVGGLNIPIYQGTKVKAEIEEADSRLQQRKAEVESMRGQIDAEVRTALLDLKSTGDQVEVAKSSMDLAQEQLRQARDRFTAGVTNNIEVIQAQETVSTANENYITSLYNYNLAKATLIRAIGGSEQAIKQVLGGTKP